MNFRKQADLLVLFPKRMLATYRDLTMPPKLWSRFDPPACDRLPARSVCAAQFGQKPRTWNSIKFEAVRHGRQATR